MYGIVEIQGHQFKVQAGDIIDVNRMGAEEGATVDFDSVLMIGGGNTVVGTPHIGGAKVTAKVIKHDKGKKKMVAKRNPGKYFKVNGFRPSYTALLITELSDGQGNTEKIDSKSKNAKFLK